jgi:DNA polymerase-3 subunit gamma/tau
MASQVHATEPAPARVQEEAPQPPAQPIKASASAPKAVGLRKAKQQVVAPTGNIKVKPQKEGPSETPESRIDPAWNEPVTAEALTKAWMGFVEKLRKEDRIALTATMSLGDPELRGMHVVYGVNNPLQREQMDGLRTEVLVHLKTTLKNASLELHLEMKEQAMEEKKAFLSDKDRYDMMVEKNPALDKLRKALDLDLG